MNRFYFTIRNANRKKKKSNQSCDENLIFFPKNFERNDETPPVRFRIPNEFFLFLFAANSGFYE